MCSPFIPLAYLFVKSPTLPNPVTLILYRAKVVSFAIMVACRHWTLLAVFPEPSINITSQLNAVPPVNWIFLITVSPTLIRPFVRASLKRLAPVLTPLISVNVAVEP